MPGEVSEALARAMLQACPAGLLLVDEAGTIRFTNSELEAMFGYLPGELVGLSLDLLIPSELSIRHSAWVRDFARRAEPRPLGGSRPLRALRPDGTEFPVDVALSHVLTPNGPFVLAVVADMTDRRAREREAELRQRALEQANADLEQFVSIASHDLREPLRMVVSYTQLLAERYQGQLDEKADKFIGYAVEGALRMQRLIDDLLVYARLENAGRPSMPTALSDALRDTLSDMRVLIQESGVQVHYGALPTVMVDPVQLVQLLQSVLHNAIKFRRGDSPSVEIAAEREGAMWRITVQDNGIGIEKRFIERIFQMFQRLHERGRYDGNGIGLSIAKKIVERHGGRIGVSSVLGEGSTFWFTLPAANPEQG
jgi:PAS domain S-box-containing protein